MSCLLYLLTIFLFLHIFVTASPLIRDSCKKAAAKDRKLNLNFCVQTLEGNPQSKTAKNLHELALASTTYAKMKIESFKTKIRKNLDERKYPKNSDMQIRECLELYESQVDLFRGASVFIKEHDYKGAINNMNECLDDLDTCETGFKERVTPTHSPFAKENDVVTQLMKIPLAFTNMLNKKY